MQLLSAGDSAGEPYQYEDGGRYTLIRREVSTSDHNGDLRTPGWANEIGRL